MSNKEEVPKLVPARMLNEFVYCKRLFFLEWVEGQFAHSADTVEGLFQHRAVDKNDSRLPFESDRETSITLSSERLGLIAVIDSLEHCDDGSVIPIETKKGSPPDGPSRSWEPDRIQLCAQGLLLQENGYQCHEGAIFYAETRERISIPFANDLINHTQRRLVELRVAALAKEAPPPLIDSPKCPRCSLVGICMPDETNAILERSQLPPRRLIPRDDNGRPVYVTEQGATVGVRGECLHITAKHRRPALVKLIDVSQLCLYGSVQISSQTIRRLFTREIPTCWFSTTGWFQGIATGLPSKHIELRRRQFLCSNDKCLGIARQMIAGKIRNSRTLIRRNLEKTTETRRILSSLQKHAEDALDAQSFTTLLGIEGAAARAYFSVFNEMLISTDLPGESFRFEGRNRRPPTDAINCLLGYLYAILTKDLTIISHAVGLDPYMGIYHRPRFGRPALALDLVEEFRPIVADSTAITLVNNNEILPSHFISRGVGVALTQQGKRVVLGAHERRMESEIKHPLFGYRARYRRILEVQCRLLGAYLLGEAPKYVAFETR